MNRKVYAVFVPLLCIMIHFSVMPVVAAESGISVELIMPDRQLDFEKSSYDFLLNPGEQQELTLIVYNHWDIDIEVQIEAVAASTNEQGVITYTGHPQWDDSTKLYDFAQLIDVPQPHVLIEPKTNVPITLTVNMPEDAPEGVILGGICIRQETLDESDEIFNSQFAYVVPVKLSTSGERIPVQFELGDIVFEPQENRAGIMALIRNTAPALARQVTVNAVLYDEAENAWLYRSISGIEMAPNSGFPLRMIDDAGTGLSPGEYHLEVNVSCEEETWRLEAPVLLTAAQLKGLSSTNAAGPRITGLLRVLLFIIGTVVVVALIAFLGLLIHVHLQNRKYRAYMRRMERGKRGLGENKQTDGQEGGVQ